MSSILLKDIPAKIHRSLKRKSRINHRSMNKQAILILEQALAASTIKPAREPKLPEKPLSAKWVTDCIRSIRDTN